ncbi:MAG TPA: hypothetical protein VFQ76_16980, partial [Longimicrobiaceae bacterium]|nr:hypothetical protein [Longimicrobiaceae bacterium]
KLGFLAHARMVEGHLSAGTLPPGAQTVEAARHMLFNDRLDAAVALVFMAVTLLVIATSLREWALVLLGRKPPVVREAPFVPSALVAGD